MKNLKRLTKKRLKTINGGAVWCPEKPITSCDIWCGWSPWQKAHCILGEFCKPC